jgi:hypothetical protein
MALEIDTSTSATGLLNFYDLYWDSSQVSHGNMIIIGTYNRINYEYCVCFIIYTQLTNVSAGRTIQPGGTLVENPFPKESYNRTGNVRVT